MVSSDDLVLRWRDDWQTYANTVSTTGYGYGSLNGGTGYSVRNPLSDYFGKSSELEKRLGGFVDPRNQRVAMELQAIAAQHGEFIPSSEFPRLAAAYSGLNPALGPGSSPTGGVYVSPYAASPPPPHPDASNLALGPNLGGADGVVLPSDMQPTQSTTMASGGAGGFLLLAGGALVLILLLKKK